MKKAVFLLGALVLGACTNQAQGPSADAGSAAQVDADAVPVRLTMPNLTPDQQAAVTSLLEACPGLTKYSDHLALESVSPTVSDQGREVTWRMDDPLTGVPAQYAATGHRCFAQIGGTDPHAVSVTKRPCVKVCLDSPADVPTSTAIRIR
ncbi:hypothetical protein [Pseudoxanthomonas winnipegensis]|uniref:hypothetical protein n=1 Tax=Pseudoxanthomonas winnipegensis TaxID=2480810 RepID=UPI00103D2864|nr:hypothetical protein [Pseudoxanthomonas winnipegensis]TBV76858.1 hypothetical protein EYC45_01450 [Pseudoxanthomonas winnipegensis]